MTKIQMATIGALILYLIWEIVVMIWAKKLPPSDPIIRADLILIYPVLIVLIIISIIQLLRSKMAGK